MNLKIVLTLIKETFKEWQEDKASRLAAALAYYTVFSLTPLLLIVIVVAGWIFGEDAAQGEIVTQLEGLLGAEGARMIEIAIQNTNQAGSNSGAIASCISVAVLIFGATGMFVQLQDALNTIWNVQPKPGRGLIKFITKRILSFAMILGVALLLLLSLLLSAILTAITHYFSDLILGFNILLQILDLVLPFGIITLLFALIYKFLPDVKIAWSDVWIGAGITALLFSIGKWLIGLYLGQSSFGSTYGAAGSLVILVAWANYSAQILFLGAEFTQVYARKYGSQIFPDKHAVSIEKNIKF